MVMGKCAIVLGASGGIGGGIAEALANKGVHVAAVDRDLNRAHELSQRYHGQGSINPFQVRLGDFDSESQLLTKIYEEYGAVDILVNNTGGPVPSSALDVSSKEWLLYFRSMFLSVVHLTDSVLPSMVENGWGRIITSTSSGVITPIKGLGISNTLRSGLLGWAKTLANEVGRYGVTSNIVVPGRISSPRAIEMDQSRAKEAGTTPQQVAQKYIDQIPVGRYGTPSEYGDSVAFLASNDAKYVNGTVLRIDGGMIPAV